MNRSRGRLLAGIDHLAALDGLRERRVNYTPDEVVGAGWNVDTHRHQLGTESPGPAEPGGVWETACALVRDYEFSAPDRIRAIYRRNSPLLDRNLLLEARFSGLRFHMGVRVTEVIEADQSEQAWGWAYETLDGHLERGRMSYQVIKNPASGQVDFLVSGYSQRSPALGRILRMGWAIFGRRTQLRFYRHCAERLATQVRESMVGNPPAFAPEEDGIVLAPSDAAPRRFDRIRPRYDQPG